MLAPTQFCQAITAQLTYGTYARERGEYAMARKAFAKADTMLSALDAHDRHVTLGNASDTERAAFDAYLAAVGRPQPSPKLAPKRSKFLQSIDRALAPARTPIRSVLDGYVECGYFDNLRSISELMEAEQLLVDLCFEGDSTAAAAMAIDYEAEREREDAFLERVKEVEDLPAADAQARMDEFIYGAPSPDVKVESQKGSSVRVFTDAYTNPVMVASELPGGTDWFLESERMSQVQPRRVVKRPGVNEALTLLQHIAAERRRLEDAQLADVDIEQSLEAIANDWDDGAGADLEAAGVYAIEVPEHTTGGPVATYTIEQLRQRWVAEVDNRDWIAKLGKLATATR